jgi:hypothetical protein
MHYTKVLQPSIISSIDIVGAKCITITYTDGRKWTLTNVIWSASQNDSGHSDPTGGSIHFSQLGAMSGGGVGAPVSVEKPLLLDSNSYTNLETLVSYLILNLI